ncbi:hypothetical protein BGZ83_009192 [Gryganskiella cystojenkinii]|nr:hypothetical protein BGZ83_009192 [Gryganskiella cystojenkinii]
MQYQQQSIQKQPLQPHRQQQLYQHQYQFNPDPYSSLRQNYNESGEVILQLAKGAQGRSEPAHTPAVTQTMTPNTWSSASSALLTSSSSASSMASVHPPPEVAPPSLHQQQSQQHLHHPQQQLQISSISKTTLRQSTTAPQSQLAAAADTMATSNNVSTAAASAPVIPVKTIDKPPAPPRLRHKHSQHAPLHYTFLSDNKIKTKPLRGASLSMAGSDHHNNGGSSRGNISYNGGYGRVSDCDASTTSGAAASVATALGAVILPRRGPNKRACNSYFVYRREQYEQNKAEFKSRGFAGSDISKVIAKMWHEEPESTKRLYEAKADFEKYALTQSFPEYKYQKGGERKSIQAGISLSQPTVAVASSVKASWTPGITAQTMRAQLAITNNQVDRDPGKEGPIASGIKRTARAINRDLIFVTEGDKKNATDNNNNNNNNKNSKNKKNINNTINNENQHPVEHTSAASLTMENRNYIPIPGQSVFPSREDILTHHHPTDHSQLLLLQRQQQQQQHQQQIVELQAQYQFEQQQLIQQLQLQQHQQQQQKEPFYRYSYCEGQYLNQGASYGYVNNDISKVDDDSGNKDLDPQ